MCKLDHRAGKLPIPCETVHLNFSCHSVSYTLGNFEVMLRESSKNDLFTVTIHLIVRGLKNVFFMAVTPPLYHYPTILWQSSSNSKKELGILEVGWKGLNKDLTIFNWYTLCTRVTKKQFLKRNLLIVLQQKFSLPNNLWWCFASKDAFPFFHILDTFQGQIRLIFFYLQVYKNSKRGCYMRGR